MKRIFQLILLLFIFTGFAYADHAEVVGKDKGIAARILFPIKKTDGTVISSAAGIACTQTAYLDSGADPTTATACTNTPTEVSTSGIYIVNLTAAEMNSDYIFVKITSSSTGAIVSTINISTRSVWDSVLSSHITSGTAGNLINLAVNSELVCEATK